MYTEKATKFCEIFTVDLSYVVPVKTTVEISQNFVAFSEFMNFTFLKDTESLSIETFYMIYWFQREIRNIYEC